MRTYHLRVEDIHCTRPVPFFGAGCSEAVDCFDDDGGCLFSGSEENGGGVGVG